MVCFSLSLSFSHSLFIYLSFYFWGYWVAIPNQSLDKFLTLCSGNNPERTKSSYVILRIESGFGLCKQTPYLTVLYCHPFLLSSLTLCLFLKHLAWNIWSLTSTVSWRFFSSLFRGLIEKKITSKRNYIYIHIHNHCFPQKRCLQFCLTSTF